MKEFEKVMGSKFEMSAMGELTFFLGLQVEQQETGIYIHQKYVLEMLKKYGMENSTPINTLIPTSHKLTPNVGGRPVDPRVYCGMIGSLMYLTASRPDIMFLVCLCSRFQSAPRESHVVAFKRIFRTGSLVFLQARFQL